LTVTSNGSVARISSTLAEVRSWMVMPRLAARPRALAVETLGIS
jgi:hypothetical protein